MPCHDRSCILIIQKGGIRHRAKPLLEKRGKPDGFVAQKNGIAFAKLRSFSVIWIIPFHFRALGGFNLVQWCMTKIEARTSNILGDPPQIGPFSAKKSPKAMSDFSVDFTKSYARRRPEELGGPVGAQWERGLVVFGPVLMAISMGKCCWTMKF